MNLRKAVLTVLLGSAVVLAAQPLPEFNMSDTVVTDCKGILLDSEAGPGGAIYGNNEDFVFTIDAGGIITLVFDPVFCTEQGLDILTFHDGPSILSPQIGPPYSGIVAPPPIVATSGFLTVHFVSDASVAYCGFEAQWTTEVEPPLPPVMSIPVPPPCNTAMINIAFSDPVPCDSIVTGAFILIGNGSPDIVAAAPVGCTGGTTSAAQLTVDPAFEYNCPYQLEFTLGIPDRCDSIWMFTISASTQLTGCPLVVNATVSNDTLCAGTCVQLNAEVQGCLNYTYAWDNGVPTGPGPHTVCPTTTTGYTVVVTETGTGQTAQSTVTVVVSAPQVVPLAGPICQSAPAFDLVASPPGGWWSGAGILDTLSGTLDPDTAGPGVHPITYTLPGGCSSTVQLVVDSMDAGPVLAACPGTPPFQITGATPAGGTWSGPFVQANGTFDPSTIGSYTVTYAAGACLDSTTVNVDNITGTLPWDTLCQSAVPDTLSILPAGGLWFGPGIVDTLLGIFDPHEAGGGDHVLIYAPNGCSAQFQLHILPADIGNDRSSCPSQAPFTLSPAAVPPGGTWSGLGIIDPLAGIYDPFLAGGGGNVNDELTYAAPNGCIDTVTMFVRWTDVTNDTLVFCADEDPIELNRNTTDRTPWGGDWSGPGVTLNADGDHFFTPSLAGPGLHVLTYLANTCSDTLLIVVYPQALPGADTLVCALDAPFVLAQLPPGASISGPGITDPTTGLFDPALAQPGMNILLYEAPAGCADSIHVEVAPFEIAMISGVLPVYCSNDVVVNVQLDPPGGVFTGIGGTTFNPAQLPDGTYTLVYTVGTGNCISSDTLVLIDHPPLSTTLLVSQDPICDGGGSTLEVVPVGGLPGAPVFFQWNNGLFPVASHTVSPTVTTTYTVVTADGCSDAVVDSVTIDVFPPFFPSFQTSPQDCYGEPGSITASVPQPGNYSYAWSGTPPQSGPVFTGFAGQNVFVTVTEDQSGCAVDTLLQIPGWPPVTALFSVNPDVDCVPWDARDVTFIDLSNNADSGHWEINGTVVPYVPGSYPQYDHGQAGTYSVMLVVFNEGGCSDSLSLDVCIQDATPVFIPDIFSPNGDGANDVLYVRGPAIAELDLTIFDRWGGEVFRTRNPDMGWDGTHAGRPVPSGVYVYMGTARLKDGSTVQLGGDVTLVR